MDSVNQTLYIPLYGKAAVSKQGILLCDPMAEKIWEQAGFPLRRKSRSRWLAYNMGMRAAVFDRWLSGQMECRPEAAVVHIGCGLDSRCLRVKGPYADWVDGDLPEVISLRRKYSGTSDRYHMMGLDASDAEQIGRLPDRDTAIVVLEGLSMYLTNE